jgi:hypothetical protein
MMLRYWLYHPIILRDSAISTCFWTEDKIFAVTWCTFVDPGNVTCGCASHVEPSRHPLEKRSLTLLNLLSQLQSLYQVAGSIETIQIFRHTRHI